MIRRAPVARTGLSSLRGSLTIPLDHSAPASVDRDLLARCARGDEAALAALYDRYGGPIYAVALRITGEQVDADEVALETFAQAWREAERFAGDRGSAAAWLTMIARSRALDLVRMRTRRGRLADQALAADPTGSLARGSAPAGADRAVEGSERREQVSRALAELPAPQRTAIELAYYHGLSQSEIAERLQEPLGTVKTRVRAGMQKLRELLRPYYYEAGV